MCVCTENIIECFIDETQPAKLWVQCNDEKLIIGINISAIMHIIVFGWHGFKRRITNQQIKKEYVNLFCWNNIVQITGYCFDIRIKLGNKKNLNDAKAWMYF